MRKKVFLIVGTTLCITFAYATYTGWSVSDSVKSGQWKPQGQKTYHK